RLTRRLPRLKERRFVQGIPCNSSRSAPPSTSLVMASAAASRSAKLPTGSALRSTRCISSTARLTSPLANNAASFTDAHRGLLCWLLHHNQLTKEPHLSAQGFSRIHGRTSAYTPGRSSV